MQALSARERSASYCGWQLRSAASSRVTAFIAPTWASLQRGGTGKQPLEAAQDAVTLVAQSLERGKPIANLRKIGTAVGGRCFDTREVPDARHFVRRKRVDADGPAAHLVGLHVGRGCAGHHQRVGGRRVPAFAEERDRADNRSQLTLAEHGRHCADRHLPRRCVWLDMDVTRVGDQRHRTGFLRLRVAFLQFGEKLVCEE